MADNKKITNSNLLKKSPKFSRTQLSIFVLVFALIGGYLLWKSFAIGPLAASLEAEQMTSPTGVTVINDLNASAGKAIQLLTNSSVAGSVNFSSSVTNLTIRARGDQCSGAPSMTASIDGKVVLSNISVSGTSWAGYSTSLPNPLAAGSHNLSISFTNDNSSTKGHGKHATSCSRNLYVDVTNFYGATPPPTPAPAISLSASPTTLTSGQASMLTWTSTNATSCSASGAWSGSEPASGSASTGALNVNSTYTLTCIGLGGSTNASATVAVSPPTTTNPSGVASLSAGLETGDLSEFSFVNASATATLTASTSRAFLGNYSAHATTPGNATSENKYARGIFEANWGEGTQIDYGMAVYLPAGFHNAMQGQVDLMRWDNFSLIPDYTERNGIVIYGSDKKAYFVRQKLHIEQTALVGGFDITEGVWHRIEVKSKLSQTDGVAWSEVYLDGNLVGRSTQHNYFGTPVTRIRYGLVATNDGVQSNSLELWFDQAFMSPK